MARQTTPNYGFPYYEGGDQADGASQQEDLANTLDSWLGIIIRAAIHEAVPIGMPAMWLFADPPDKWMFMLGQTDLAVGDYPELAVLLGSTGGVLNMPDWRGLFPAGAGGAIGVLGTVGGLATVQLTAGQSGMRSHNHAGAVVATSPPDHTHSTADGRSFGELQAGDTINWPGEGAQSFVQHSQPRTGGVYPSAATLQHSHVIPTEPSSGAPDSHENRPPFRAVNFIIKAEP